MFFFYLNLYEKRYSASASLTCRMFCWDKGVCKRRRRCSLTPSPLAAFLFSCQPAGTLTGGAVVTHSITQSRFSVSGKKQRQPTHVPLSHDSYRQLNRFKECEMFMLLLLHCNTTSFRWAVLVGDTQEAL